MPIGPTGQEFWPKYNFCVLPLKLVDSIFIVPRNKWKNLLQEKKNYVKFFSKMPHDSTGQNFSFFFSKIQCRIFCMKNSRSHI